MTLTCLEISVQNNSSRKPCVLFSVERTTISLNAVGVMRLQRILFTQRRMRSSGADIATWTIISSKSSRGSESIPLDSMFNTAQRGHGVTASNYDACLQILLARTVVCSIRCSMYPNTYPAALKLAHLSAGVSIVFSMRHWECVEGRPLNLRTFSESAYIKHKS